jgi:hypothetical protein
MKPIKIENLTIKAEDRADVVGPAAAVRLG